MILIISLTPLTSFSVYRWENLPKMHCENLGSTPNAHNNSPGTPKYMIIRQLAADSYRSSPPLNPPKIRPIYFGTYTLAKLPAPAMHNLYTCHKQSGCVKNVRGRGVYANDHSSTILHHFGRKMAHSQTCFNPAAFQSFRSTSMLI